MPSSSPMSTTTTCRPWLNQVKISIWTNGHVHRYTEGQPWGGLPGHRFFNRPMMVVTAAVPQADKMVARVIDQQSTKRIDSNALGSSNWYPMHPGFGGCTSGILARDRADHTLESTALTAILSLFSTLPNQTHLPRSMRLCLLLLVFNRQTLPNATRQNPHFGVTSSTSVRTIGHTKPQIVFQSCQHQTDEQVSSSRPFLRLCGPGNAANMDQAQTEEGTAAGLATARPPWDNQLGTELYHAVVVPSDT